LFYKTQLLKVNCAWCDHVIRVSGSLYGRAFGVGLCYMWQSISGTPYPTDTWKWIDPGIMAAVGAAGLLGGVNRIATASTVIVVRNTPDWTATNYRARQNRVTLLRQIGYLWNCQFVTRCVLEIELLIWRSNCL